MAQANEHPQAKAINVLAWIGLLTLGLGWFLALVWANMKPVLAPAELEQRVAELEKKLQQQEAGS